MLHRRRIGWSLGGCVVIALLALPAWPQQERALTPTQLFMRLKLDPAKQILEAIATENYDQIASNAQQVQTLSLDEKWNVLQTPAYQRNSQEFQTSLQLLRDAAKARNLDGATLAYMQMTWNCVRCHRDLRVAPQP